MNVRIILSGLLIAATLSACSTETVQSNQVPSLQNNNVKNQEKSEIPDLFTNVMEELKKNPVPVVLPKTLPPVLNPREYNAVKVKTSTDGYEITIYSTSESGNKDGGITMEAMKATFSGRIVSNYHPGEDYVEGMKEKLKYSKAIVIDRTPMTYYSVETNPIGVGGDLVVWHDGNWLLATQGNPNDIGQSLDQAPEYTSIGLARELLKLMKPIEGKEIKRGFILGQEAPKRTLKLEWTYDDRIWYSIDSFNWNYVFAAMNSLVKLK